MINLIRHYLGLTLVLRSKVCSKCVVRICWHYCSKNRPPSIPISRINGVLPYLTKSSTKFTNFWKNSHTLLCKIPKHSTLLKERRKGKYHVQNDLFSPASLLCGHTCAHPMKISKEREAAAVEIFALCTYLYA